MLKYRIYTKKIKPIWLLPATVIMLLVISLAGPTIFLNLLLSSVIPGQTGLRLEYSRARAGFLFHSARVADLRIGVPGDDPDRPIVSIKRVRLEGVSLWNVIRLVREPAALPAEGLFLADDVTMEDIERPDPAWPVRLEGARVRRLSVAPGPPAGTLPLRFDAFEARNLALSYDFGLPNPEPGLEPARLKISRLEARHLGPEILGGFAVRGLEIDSGRPSLEARTMKLNLGDLSLGGVHIEALRQALAGGDPGQGLWWLLSGCDRLDLAQAVLFRDDREALNIASALFDSSADGRDGTVTYTRRLQGTADLTNLALEPDEPFWRDLRDITGDRFAVDLDLALDFQPSASRAALKTGHLELPGLGRLDLTASLTGVTALKARHSPYQLLRSAYDWNLAGLRLTFDDQGVMANFYRHLDRTVFRGAPMHQSAANIMEYVVRPEAEALEYEQGLANLPALVSEVEAFLNRPNHFQITAAPAPPLPLKSLVNLDRYDIIEKLRLTLEVDDRAPVSVAVASGVFQERLPSAPRPMEHFFDGDGITEEDL